MNRLWNRCLLIALILSPLNSWALSSDREQPMLIEADRAELDDANGISIYRGNVKVTQGTLILTGDVMTVHTKGNDVEKVIMEGQPATYKQRPDNKDKDVRAKALHMEYFTNPEKIILTGQAEVEQGGGDILRSERIEYDVPTDKVNAGTDKPDERVHITIQPRPGKEKKTPAKP
ncbi:MAG: lipopolysaccharide transport periplasmic protein LptA [Gammaproteobacteria bacterium]|nr:MAG: lipopolysaccharide transport periplasmic protein LptA [Gammaproteobacteria bacterium]